MVRRQFSSAAELEEGRREPNGAGVPLEGGHPREAEPEVEGDTEPDDIPELPYLNAVDPSLGFLYAKPINGDCPCHLNSQWGSRHPDFGGVQTQGCRPHGIMGTRGGGR